MDQNKNHTPVGSSVVLLLVVINALIAKYAFIVNEDGYWALTISFPLLLIAMYNNNRKKHPIID